MRHWALPFLTVLSILSCEHPESVPVKSPDTTPPARVTDLTTTNPSNDSVRLSWTATGDDGDNGLPDQYEIRFSRSSLADDEWLSVETMVQVAANSEPGSQITAAVTGLVEDKNYYFVEPTP